MPPSATGRARPKTMQGRLMQTGAEFSARVRIWVMAENGAPVSVGSSKQELTVMGRP